MQSIPRLITAAAVSFFFISSIALAQLEYNSGILWDRPERVEGAMPVCTPAPEGAVVLFDGGDITKTFDNAQNWVVKDGYAEVHNGCYGTSRSFVQQQMEAGNDVILEIEMQGALQVKATDPNAVLIFILPPSYEELKRRLVGRQSETPEQVEKRLSDAVGQLAFAYIYDSIVVNDDLDEAVEAVAGIIRTSRLNARANKKRIDDLKRSFQEVK